MTGVLTCALPISRRRRYLLDGKPVEFATSYLPLDIARGTQIAEPNPGPGGIYARLEDHGHEFAEFVETLQARLATKAEASELALSPGASVVHLIREARTTEDRVVEVCDTLMAADQFVFSYRIPAFD